MIKSYKQKIYQDWNHEEIENLKRFKSSKEIESIMKIPQPPPTPLPTATHKKAWDKMASLVNSIKHLKKN